MKPFSLAPMNQRPEASIQTVAPETKLKGNEIAKFLCLRCRCLGACCKVNGVSFSSFVVPIYAAALANSPDGLQGFLNFEQDSRNLPFRIFPLTRQPFNLVLRCFL